MMNDTFNTPEFDVLVTSGSREDSCKQEQDFNGFIQANPLRLEIFNAITRLETSKIRLIDNEFTSLLNRFG